MSQSVPSPSTPAAKALNPAARADWQADCRRQGIDPVEVEMVSSRYAAYRAYMDPRGGGLGLEEWFRFYRLEKASETGAQAGLVSGCSATGEGNVQNCLTSPAPFLELLKEHLRLSGLH
jgi:hypothetical protein